ncbi:hypothetical protein SARC_09819, partial [Sphaeroforma arctica JP610]
MAHSSPNWLYYTLSPHRRRRRGFHHPGAKASDTSDTTGMQRDVNAVCDHI